MRYSGADTGEGVMLSLLVRDAEGQPLKLLRLEQPAAAEGTLQLKLDELELPEGAALYLFCEQLGEAHQTNYASPLQELRLEQPETPEEPESTGTIAPVQDDPQAEPAEPAAEEPETPVTPADPQKTAEEQRESRLFTLIVLGAAALLTIVLIIAAIYRRSILPVVLLILVLLLAVLVYMRMFRRLPALELEELKKRF